MADYVFMTDSNSDLQYTYRDEHQIPIVYMPYTIEGKEFFADLGEGGNNIDFYNKLRGGALANTSLLPKDNYLEYFEPILEKGKDLLFIAFSSQLSNTIENIYAAREELLEKYPERKFMVVDTMSISAPQTLLIKESYKLYAQGKTMEEVAQWVEENKMHAHALLTVDDLKYLKRGGRISGASALVGSMLDIKPILAMGKNGKIVPAGKVQGRKKALRTLADMTVEWIENPEEQTIIIMHADAPEDAQKLQELVKSRIPNLGGIDEIFVGPVIGTHCGPGTVAVCFLGKERKF